MADLSEGVVLGGRFEIIGAVGRGGMATVYLATDRSRGERVALKTLLPQYAEDCSGEGNMHDTAMLFGLLGWDGYDGRGDIVTDYFPSSGTGQCNVVFAVQ